MYGVPQHIIIMIDAQLMRVFGMQMHGVVHINFRSFIIICIVLYTWPSYYKIMTIIIIILLFS